MHGMNVFEHVTNCVRLILSPLWNWSVHLIWDTSQMWVTNCR